jgi:hypothetical protein
MTPVTAQWLPIEDTRSSTDCCATVVRSSRRFDTRCEAGVMPEYQASGTGIVGVLDQFLQDRKAALVSRPRGESDFCNPRVVR